LVAWGGGGGGGGGFQPSPCSLLEAVNPRESVQVALTVMDPGEAPVVVSVAELPLPEMLPPLAVHPPTVTGTLSGLVQLQVMVAGASGLNRTMDLPNRKSAADSAASP
jgi:hypothetical protein